MKKINLYFIIVLITGLTLLSCNSKCSVEGIDVPETIQISSKEKGINYCELLEKSLQKEKNSVVKLSLLDFDGSSGYDHGTILVDLVKKLGEDEYIVLINQVNSNEKKKIEAYLEVGLMYHYDDKLKEKSVDESFPKLSTFLRESH